MLLPFCFAMVSNLIMFLWFCSFVIDGDNPQRTQNGPEELTKPMYQSVIKKEGSSMVGMAMGMGMGAGLRSAAEAASLADDYVSPPKYKSSLLHRYLNDSLRHVMVANAVMDARKRNHSGSFSSNEYDDELLSPSSSEAEANFVYRAGKEPHFLHSFPSRVSLAHTTSFTFVLLFFFFLVPSICTFCFNSHSWSIISNCLPLCCPPASLCCCCCSSPLPLFPSNPPTFI